MCSFFGVSKWRSAVVDRQSVYYTLFALKRATVESENVCSKFLTSCLAVIFGLKLLVFSQLYRVPKLTNQFI